MSKPTSMKNTAHNAHPNSTIIQPNTPVSICTYNVRTLHEEHLDNFLIELEHVKWDIIGLCETKLKQEFVSTVLGDHELYNSGVHEDSNRRDGVGFLVHKKHKDAVIGFTGVSERVAMLKLRGRYNNTVIIQCYAPSTSHSDEEVEQFYAVIQDLINTKVPKRDILLVNGDFNAKIGGLHTTAPGIVGPYNNVKRGNNERDVLLVDFCKQNNFIISNTQFKHRRQWTWMSPGDRTRNSIDFVLVRHTAKKHITDTHVISTPDISDHRLVRCKIKLRFLKRDGAMKHKIPRFDIGKLHNPVTANSFNENVTSLLKNDITLLTDSQDIMNNIEYALITSSEQILGKQPLNDVNNWITDATKQFILEKHLIRQTHGPSSLEYRIAKANAKKLCKIDKVKHIENLHKELQMLPITQQFYKVIKMIKLSGETPVRGWSIKSSDGTVLTEHSDILARWHEFYSSLYASDRTAFQYFMESDDPIPVITLSELRRALEMLKTDKAPGPDGITVEMLRAGGEHLLDALLTLLNMIIKNRQIPSQFLLSEIILLFKKGDLLDCGNYRPISLLCHVYKLLLQIIYLRIRAPLLEAIQSNQAAYQHGRSTVEQIQIMQQVIEKCNEFQRECVICFVDFRKAFDTVNQQELWNALRKYTSLNPAYINLLAKLYESSRTRVRTDVGMTELIDLLRGVKQGDIASALLFCLALMVILLETFDGFEGGISIGGVMHTDEAYADDIAIITVNTVQMNEILERLRASAAKFGLEINIPKTKIMHVANAICQPCVIGDEVLEVVLNFEYLGRVLSNVGDDMVALQNRIGKGWSAFRKKESILKDRHIPMVAKRKTYETFVLPCVLYATETFTWSPQLVRKLQKFENDAMRWMTNRRLISRTSIRQLYAMTGLKKIAGLVKSKKARWFGHIKRSTLPVRVAIEGMVEGKRRQGRPKRRWRTDILEWCGVSWTQINATTVDRAAWRLLCNSLLDDHG